MWEIILKWILEGYDGVARTGLIWLRIGTSGATGGFSRKTQLHGVSMSLRWLSSLKPGIYIKDI
jgi:hypothetical protein